MLEKEEHYTILLSVCGNIVDQLIDICMFQTIQEGNEKSDHKVLVYAKEVMSFGLLYTELVDAVHEGDGFCVFRWWRFMLKLLSY